MNVAVPPNLVLNTLGLIYVVLSINDTINNKAEETNKKKQKSWEME